MKKILIILAVFATLAAKAQIETPVTWSFGSKRVSATEAVVFFKATIEDGWHVFSQFGADGPVKTVFTFAPSKTYALVGKAIEPKPITTFEKSFGVNINYFENEVIFQQKIKLKSAAQATVKGKFEFGVCNASKCLPPDEQNFSVAVKAFGAK